MKKLLLLLTLLTAGAFANDIVFFDPVSSPVSNRVTRYAYTLNEPDYYGSTNALILTNKSVQIGAGVMTNLFGSVVQGQLVRLMTQSELDRIAATNAILQSISEAQAKVDARVYASNVVNGVDGLSLYLRGLAETTWFYVNQIRTNQGYPALTRVAFKNMIDTNIANFGQ